MGGNSVLVWNKYKNMKDVKEQRAKKRGNWEHWGRKYKNINQITYIFHKERKKLLADYEQTQKNKKKNGVQLYKTQEEREQEEDSDDSQSFKKIYRMRIRVQIGGIMLNENINIKWGSLLDL